MDPFSGIFGLCVPMKPFPVPIRAAPATASGKKKQGLPPANRP